MKKTKRFSDADLALMAAKVRGVTELTATKKPKYGNKKVTQGGMTFDSKRECERYSHLLLLQRAGVIKDLKCQVPFVLAPAADLGEKRKKPALRYKADFAYTNVETGRLTVEDAKGMQTPEYRIKKHLMATVHQIIVQEV